MHLKPALTPTTTADAELLVSMRIAAMRDSLERLGRFDPQRARERFLGTFDPALCRFIEAKGVRVGFCVVRPLAEAWHLDHLYLLPEHQGKGLGGAVLGQILADVDSCGLPIRLGALRGSRANAFYRRHGFEPVEEAEWDIYYLKRPAPARASTDQTEM